MTNTRLRSSILLALLVLISAALSACVSSSEAPCIEEECYDEYVVECDPWGCVEVYVDTHCQCIGEGCLGDKDCRIGEYCSRDGYCLTDRTDGGGGVDSGSVNLCGACNSHEDCAESGARCLTLSATEAVCGQSCSANSECPQDFECMDLEGESGRQCVPSSFTCQGANPSDSCQTDTDCGTTQHCDGDRCIDGASPECIENNDCSVNQVCEAGSCITPASLGCTAHDQCGQGEYCNAEGECGPAPRPDCLENIDCSNGQVCDRGACVEPTPECIDDQGCSNGQVCETGACVDVTPAGCQLHSECAQGELCVNSVCVSDQPAACTDSSACAGGEICDAGFCRVIECTTTAECTGNEQCVNAECVPGCDALTPCPGGYLCRESLGFCEADPAAECQENSQCTEGNICDGGACLMACAASCECPQGEICDADRGVCSAETPTNPVCTVDCDCPSGDTCVEGLCVAPG